jgi:hypothetical protein
MTDGAESAAALSDRVQLTLQAQPIERPKRKREEEADPSFKL